MASAGVSEDFTLLGPLSKSGPLLTQAEQRLQASPEPIKTSVQGKRKIHFLGKSHFGESTTASRRCVRKPVVLVSGALGTTNTQRGQDMLH